MSWPFQTFLNTQREVLSELLQSNTNNTVIKKLQNCRYRTFFVQNGFFDLQVPFVDLCIHGHADIAEVLCRHEACVITEDSELGLMLCCHHFKVLLFFFFRGEEGAKSRNLLSPSSGCPRSRCPQVLLRSIFFAYRQPPPCCVLI